MDGGEGWRARLCVTPLMSAVWMDFLVALAWKDFLVALAVEKLSLCCSL